MINWRTGLLFSLILFVITTISAGCSNTVVIQGSSMEPTFKHNQRATLYRSAYDETQPERGDIVMYEFDGNNRIGRIIGLPEETISFLGGVVYINGTELQEQYLVESEQTNGDVNPLQIAGDYYFIMGDNRDLSNDSRHIGPIPRSSIKGRIMQ